MDYSLQGNRKTEEGDDHPDRDAQFDNINEQVRKALNALKKTTEYAAKELEILKRLAEEKQKEELWNRINQAIEITQGALDGAESGLTRLPPPAQDKKSRTR